MAAPTFLAHAGFHAVGSAMSQVLRSYSTLGNNVLPTEYPPTAELIRLHVHGLIPDEYLYRAARNQGARVDPTGANETDIRLSTNCWNAAWELSKEIANVGELFEISNRSLVGDEYVQLRLSRLGYFDRDVRAEMANLRYDIPGPSELVRFSVRHCWEPDLLAQLGYKDEFPGPIIDYWHACKGLDYPLFTGPFSQWVDKAFGEPGAAEGWAQSYASYGLPEPTWAQFYWYSHWILPSPSQLFQMLIRLSPDRDRSFDPPEAEGLEFGLENYLLGLRANDYPPYYRKMLAAINRLTPGVRFIRGFIQTDVYSKDDVREWARRWSYSPRDVEDITEYLWKSVKEAPARKGQCAACKICDQAYEAGILSEFDYKACLVGFGVDPKDADTRLGNLQLTMRTARVKEMIASVKRRYLKGSITIEQARTMLMQLSLQPGAITDYLDRWQFEFEAGRKELSAAQAVKYACERIISIQELVFRLGNMKYPAADINAMATQAGICQAEMDATALDKFKRADRRKKADQYARCRRLRQAVIESQRLLAATGSPKELQKWFCEGSISECDVFSRLNRLGWDDPDITRFLSDCKSGRKPTGLCPPGEPTIPPACPVPDYGSDD